MNIQELTKVLEDCRTEAQRLFDRRQATGMNEAVARFWEGTANGLDIAIRTIRDELTP